MQIEELRGLPGDPPYPVQIALPSVSTFREGYVLRISPETGEPWVGNFQMGNSRYCAFLPLHTDRIAVVAGGLGYVVDARRRVIQHTFGGDITQLVSLASSAELLAISNTDIERHSSTHCVWRSARLSWDGICDVQIEGSKLTGKAWHSEDEWHGFELELSTGQASGATFAK